MWRVRNRQKVTSIAGNDSGFQDGPTLLSVRSCTAGYGLVPVLQGISLTVNPGELVSLLGPNGAGKTTALLAITGAIRPTSGAVIYQGRRLSAPVHLRARQGIAFLPEDRSITSSLTTRENLRVARASLKRAIELFPVLEVLLGRRAGLLSGGERQILTLTRALARSPKLLIADELSLGLAPLVVARVLAALREAAKQGMGVLIVEQHVRNALRASDRAYVMRRGEIVMSGTAADLSGRLSEIEGHYLATV